MSERSGVVETVREPAARPGWGVARPAVIPRPTYFPAGLAFGITFLFWGFITSPVLLLIGLSVAVFSLGGWIREMRHER